MEKIVRSVSYIAWENRCVIFKLTLRVLSLCFVYECVSAAVATTSESRFLGAVDDATLQPLLTVFIRITISVILGTFIGRRAAIDVLKTSVIILPGTNGYKSKQVNQ